MAAFCTSMKLTHSSDKPATLCRKRDGSVAEITGPVAVEHASVVLV